MFVLYLTQEFGVGDVEVNHVPFDTRAKSHLPSSPALLGEALLTSLIDMYALLQCVTFVLVFVKVQTIGALQGGTLYGLWGTLLVAYGIVFSTAIDLLGTHPQFHANASAVVC